jgi:hypothetical protein
MPVGLKDCDFTSVFQSASFTRRLKFNDQLAARINGFEKYVGRCGLPRSSFHSGILVQAWAAH